MSRSHRFARLDLAQRGLVGCAVLACACACRERAAPIDAAPSDPTTAIHPDDTVSYVDLSGQVRRGRGVSSVPATSRHAVGVDGPDGPGGAVWIADVSIPMPSWTARRASPDELVRLGLAALPPGVASRLTFPAPDPALPPPAPDGVVVYGTSWCGACGDTRAWLDARHVHFRFRDVELDAAAAADASSLCAARDILADRIPVIDVAGRVVVGFDPGRLATILGEPI